LLGCGRGREPLPDSRLRSQKSFLRMMKACRLEPAEAVDYDGNICMLQVGSEYLARACIANLQVGVHLGKRIIRLVQAGFVLKACKNGQP